MVFLLSMRIAGAFVQSPLLSAKAMPGLARMLLVLGLAIGFSFALALPELPTSLLESPGALFMAGFAELSLGACLGLGVQLAFAAFSFAGRLLDVQMGFGLVQIFDPLTNVRTSIVSTAFDQLAALMFFLLSVHHVLLRGVAWSLERYPLAEPWQMGVALVPLLKQVSALFALGFALAAPVVFCILMVEMALGVVAHSLPQMNMLMIGLPVKIVVGLIALALWTPEMGGVLQRIYESIYSTWNQIVSGVTPVNALRLRYS